MGMDAIELVMEIEDAFKIRVPDEDAERITTVRELQDYVVSRVGLLPPPPCLTARTFYFLRRTLGDSCRVPRDAIRPSTRARSILRSTPPDAWADAVRRLRLTHLYGGRFGKAVRWPAALATVGDLARSIGGEGPWRYGVEREPADNQDTRQRVIQIISEQMGIAASEIRGEHRFIEDLNMD